MQKPLFLLLACVTVFSTGCAEDEPGTGCLVEYGTETTDTILAPNSGAQSDIAQSFKPTKDQAVSKISLKVKKVGSLDNAYELTVFLVDSDTDGFPDDTDVLAQSTIVVQSVPTQSAFVTFGLGQEVTLSSGSTYWIVLRANYPTSSTDRVEWVGHNSSTGTFSTGKAAIKNSTTDVWNDSSVGALFDLNFRVGC